MLDSNKTNNDAEPLREWTVMFYFASDNPLAPAIVSQLKAIKNAGYHPDINVVAQFDPNKNAGEFWDALAIPPRPAFYVTVTVAMVQ